MIYTWSNPSVCLFGRWDRSGQTACTVNTGSSVTLRYEGERCVLLFDTRKCVAPFPHIWIDIDGYAVESQVEEYIHLKAPTGAHTVRVTVKSAVETQHRWYETREAAVYFRGVETEKLLPPEKDERPILEFVGDSITEGILIEPDREYPGSRHEWKSEARVYQDDVLLDYSTLTAQKLGCRCRVIGFGAVGVTKSGSGNVPKAPVSYPYVYDGVPAKEEEADVVVINHGANDRGASAEEYCEGAVELVKAVRSLNPNAKIVYLTAFCGAYPEQLKGALEKYAAETGDRVTVIDSAGWIPAEPLHPLADGHAAVAEKLAAELAPLVAQIR